MSGLSPPLLSIVWASIVSTRNKKSAGISHQARWCFQGAGYFARVQIWSLRFSKTPSPISKLDVSLYEFRFRYHNTISRSSSYSSLRMLGLVKITLLLKLILKFSCKSKLEKWWGPSTKANQFEGWRWGLGAHSLWVFSSMVKTPGSFIIRCRLNFWRIVNGAGKQAKQLKVILE